LWFSGCVHLHLYDVNILMVPSLSFHLECFLPMMAAIE
jgi:hypothetical protein